MILASSIFTQVLNLLDDDDSGRYSETADLVPALNLAVDFVVTLFTAAFEQKRIHMESLSELVKTIILSIAIKTTTVSVDLDSHSVIKRDSIWTIIGVDPQPSVDAGSPIKMTDSSKKWATKLTLAEWNDSQDDPFAPGTTQSIPSDFQRISYVGPGQFFDDAKEHLLLRPKAYFTAGDKVGLWLLVTPTKVTAGASEIAFPRVLENLLVQKTLQYISMQHGAQSALGVATEKEITQLVNLMNS